MTTPPTPTVEAIRGLVEALEKLCDTAEELAGCVDSEFETPRFRYPTKQERKVIAAARAALARWRERAPLREDMNLRARVRTEIIKNGGGALPATVTDAILCALDSLLPSPPTRGAP